MECYLDDNRLFAIPIGPPTPGPTDLPFPVGRTTEPAEEVGIFPKNLLKLTRKSYLRDGTLPTGDRLNFKVTLKRLKNFFLNPPGGKNPGGVKNGFTRLNRFFKTGF